jgi:sterol desaturase/sphingolipid hydroxylase (fatty acid hydroxylase superfamily)
MNGFLNNIHGIIHEFLGNTEAFGITLLIAGSACFFIERIRPAEKNTPFFKKDFRKELILAALNSLLFVPVFSFAISLTVIALLADHVPFQMFNATFTKWPMAAQILFGVFIMDFSTYWRHRFSHRYLWPYHAFHHSAEEITWLTSMRLHPVDYFFAVLFDTIVLYILGFSSVGILAATAFIQGYNYFTHLNLNIEFKKPLRYILASPHYHRWHHATDKTAYDKNFCGVFSLLDVMFGTYYHPEGVLPLAYGLSPRDQAEVPRGLFAHLFLPIKKDLKKLRARAKN